MTTQELVPVGQRTLEELAQYINAGHQELLGDLSLAIQRAIRVGDALRDAKQQVPFGEWGAWLQTNVIVSKETANRYMRLSEFQHMLPDHLSVEHITARGAANKPGIEVALLYLKRLGVRAGTGRGAPRQYDRDEIRRLRDEGHSLRDICGLLGASMGTVTRALMPEAELRKQKQASSKAYRQRKRAQSRGQLRTTLKHTNDELSESYSLLLKSLQRMQRAHDTEPNPDVRKHIGTAISRMHAAEDLLMQAYKLR